MSKLKPLFKRKLTIKESTYKNSVPSDDVFLECMFYQIPRILHKG